MENNHRVLSDSMFARETQRILAQHARSITGFELVLLASYDGFEISSVRSSLQLQAAKLSTIASSLMAMVQAVGREVRSNSCTRLIIEMDSSTAILQAVDGPQPYILCLVIKSKSVLGMGLWASGEIVRDIANNNFSDGSL